MTYRNIKKIGEVYMIYSHSNVVTLIVAWDVEYNGESDSMLHICQCHGKFSPRFRCKYHWHML
jgi:hypothetical protein